MGLGECTIAGGGAAENWRRAVLSVEYGGAAAPRRGDDFGMYAGAAAAADGAVHAGGEAVRDASSWEAWRDASSREA